MSKITWFDHSAFKVEANGVSVLIDPFFAPGSGQSYKDAGKVDLVLITHDHGDHVGDAIAVCKETGAILGCMVGTAQALVQRGMPQEQIWNGIGFNIGGTLTCKGIEALMVQAFHSSDSGAPAGYIVRMPDGLVFYHAGDTGIFASMKLLGSLYGVRLAMLPIGGVFTMDALQAAHACKLIGCPLVIPMHWGTFPVLAQSTTEFQDILARTNPDCQCIAMQRGHNIEVEK